MENKKLYRKLLKKHKSYASFYNAAEQMLQEGIDEDNYNNDQQIIYSRSALVTGPILTAFVCWVLEIAIRKQISTLFFLARDGGILQEIAEIFIAKYNLPIQCRYLYVSRYALRKALFCVDEQEAITLLCRNSIRVTPQIVLNRTGLPAELQDKILLELGYSTIDLQKKELTAKELSKLSEQLFQCCEFMTAMRQASVAESERIFQYFCQEEFSKQSVIAIVDSGWTGSMQRCMRQILEWHNVQRPLEGFYFGILNRTKNEDGVYNSFYFSADNISRYIHFNNNLFECWCMSEHGMTVGYQENSDHLIVPLFKENSSSWYASFQRNCIKRYASIFAEQTQKLPQNLTEIRHQLIQPLIKCFMLQPDHDEAKVYGKIPFCDDSSESYSTLLAERLAFKDLLGNLTGIKIFYKLFSPVLKKTFRESGWKEGTIALLPVPWKYLWRADCQLSYLVKIIIKARM